MRGAKRMGEHMRREKQGNAGTHPVSGGAAPTLTLQAPATLREGRPIILLAITNKQMKKRI